MKMWIRKRIDISFKDLLQAFKFCLMYGSRDSVTRKIQSIWEQENQKSFVCLSVRTGFDLLFRTVNFEPGSEILMTSLTIADMPKIIAHHGFVPVPIDLHYNNLGPSIKKLEDSITTKTKAIVVAHLFGGIIDLTEILEIARKHKLLVIEDCAQAYFSRTYSGNVHADISMFSFGTIKTATALGGGILIFRNNTSLVEKIQKFHQSFPVQSRFAFLKKVSKYFLINLLSSPRVFYWVIKILERKGIDYDTFIHALSRSFSSGNFYENIRQQPSYPLLKLMLYRFETYNFSRIEKRIEKGKFLQMNLPEKCKFPGNEAFIQSYWAFPVLYSEPENLIGRLRKSGFDATHKISLKVVGKNENSSNNLLQNTDTILNQIVFLPLYPEMPVTELEKMVKCLL